MSTKGLSELTALEHSLLQLLSWWKQLRSASCRWASSRLYDSSVSLDHLPKKGRIPLETSHTIEKPLESWAVKIKIMTVQYRPNPLMENPRRYWRIAPASLYKKYKSLFFYKKDSIYVQSLVVVGPTKMYVVRPDLRLYLPDLFDSLAAVI